MVQARFASVLLAASLISGLAHAGSIRDWPCPDKIEGKWYPYSRGTIDDFGWLEIGKEHIWLSQHGRISFKKKLTANGKSYFELLRTINLGDVPQGDTVGFFTPYAVEKTPSNPELKCLMYFRSTEREEDIVKLLSGDKNHYSNNDTYLPLAHAIEFLELKESELDYEDLKKAPD